MFHHGVSLEQSRMFSTLIYNIYNTITEVKLGSEVEITALDKSANETMQEKERAEALGTHGRSSRSTGSLSTSVSNRTLERYTTVAVNMGETHTQNIGIPIHLRMLECPDLRSSSTSWSSRAWGTSISLSTIISSLSLSTSLSISTLTWNSKDGEREPKNFSRTFALRLQAKVKELVRCQDNQVDVTYRRSSESGRSRWSSFTTLTLKRKMVTRVSQIKIS